MNPAAVSRSQTCSAAAVLPNHLTVSRGERLSPQSHHVRHCVQIDGLQIMAITSADITEFDSSLVVNLPLHSQIELMADARPEVRVQGLTRSSILRVHSWYDRLGQGRESCR